MSNNKVVKQITTDVIAPTLLSAYAYNLDKKEWQKGNFENRVVEEYEFELIMVSEGSMNYDGKTYKLEAGDLCFKRPYAQTQGEKPYGCYFVAFSMTKDDVGEIFPYYTNELLDKIPTILKVKNIKYFESLFIQIINEYVKGTSESLLMIRALLLELIYLAYNEGRQQYLPATFYKKIMNDIASYMEKNYTSNELTLTHLSDKANLSPGYLQKRFKKQFGISPNEYLSNYRIIKSKELLLFTNKSITEIALHCGFESTSYFSTVFKKTTGQTPKLFREVNYKR